MLNPADSTPPWWLQPRPIGSRGEDLLEFGPAAEILGRRLVELHGSRNPGPGMRSLTVSLEGGWGAGKTSFSNLLLEELGARGDNRQGDPVFVTLNVWQSGSMELSPWASIAYRFGESFYRRLHRQCNGDGDVLIGRPTDPETLENVEGTEKLQDPRLHWIEIAYRLSEGVPRKIWHPCLKLFHDAPTKVPGRSLSLQSGKGILRKVLTEGITSIATADTGKAIGAVSEGVGALIENRLLEGPTWGIDTEEFVGDLNRLLKVLHPTPTHWRAVLLVEDVTRLDQSELPGVLDALGYLQGLEDVLVLLNLDHQVVRLLEESAGHSQRGGETFLTKLVHLRSPIPAPNHGELTRFATKFFEDLGESVSFLPRGASALVRHLQRREIWTPRQIKRALLWLWLRWGSLREAQTVLSESRQLDLFAFLLDVYSVLENKLEPDEWLAELEESPDILGYVSRRPWSLRPWLDRAEILVDLDPQLGELILRMRLLTLCEFVGGQSEPLRAEAQRSWEVWRQKLIGLDESLFQLKSAQELPLEDLYRHLKQRVEATEFENFPLYGHICSVARHLNLPRERSRSTDPGLECCWFDADLLVARLERSEEATDKARHWLVLSLFHKEVAEHPAVRRLKPPMATEEA